MHRQRFFGRVAGDVVNVKIRSGRFHRTAPADRLRNHRFIKILPKDLLRSHFGQRNRPIRGNRNNGRHFRGGFLRHEGRLEDLNAMDCLLFAPGFETRIDMDRI